MAGYLDRLNSGKPTQPPLPKLPKPPFGSKGSFGSTGELGNSQDPGVGFGSKGSFGSAGECAENPTATCWTIRFPDGKAYDVTFTTPITQVELEAGLAPRYPAGNIHYSPHSPQATKPTKATKAGGPDSSVANVAFVATGECAENPAADRKVDRLKDMGIETFTLRAQHTDRPAPAAEILKTLSVEIILHTDPAAAQAAVTRLLEKTEKISRHPGAAGGMLGVDIETAPLPQYRHGPKAGLDPLKACIRLLQVFDPVGRCHVFDCRTVPLDILKPLLESRETVAHNAVFEMKHLRHAGIKPLRMHCSMLMARVESGEPLMSLAKAVERYLPDLPKIDKTLQTSNWSADLLSADQIHYAALDAVLARELWRELQEPIKTTGQAAAYKRMASVIPVVADQMLAGVPFDSEAHAALLNGWQSEMLPLRETLERDLGINPDSGTQLAGWLEKHLDKRTLTQWPRTPTGKLKTDEEAFERVAVPGLETLARYKTLAQQISTFGTGYRGHIHPVTGRLHPEFLIAGTRGGRFSCRSPNVQQAPAGEFRRLFRAPAGYQLVAADYSQIELRIAAILADDQAMLEAYKAGADLHRRTAAAIAGIAEEEVTKAQRQLAKACNFGLVYGMGARTLAAYAAGSYGVSMSQTEAEQAKAAFFRAYPGIARWHAATKVKGLHDPAVKTTGGLIRDLAKEPGGWQMTKALNTPVQGSGAEILLVALAALPKALAGLDAKPIIHVHDEIVLEVADRDVPAAKRALQDAMTTGFRALFPDHADMPGLVEAHAGPTWFDAKG